MEKHNNSPTDQCEFFVSFSSVYTILKGANAADFSTFREEYSEQRVTRIDVIPKVLWVTKQSRLSQEKAGRDLKFRMNVVISLSVSTFMLVAPPRRPSTGSTPGTIYSS